MTTTKWILDLIIDANLVLALTFCLWAIARFGLARSPLRSDFVLHHRLLRGALICVVASPLLAWGIGSVGRIFWPQSPMTVADLAVAAYLRGDLTLPAGQFEAMLTARDRITDAFLAGQMPALNVVAALFATVALFHLARMARTVIILRQVIRQSYVWRRSRKVDIRLSDQVAIPFATRGLLRRHVVLPSSLVTEPDELRVVLAHELQHHRQGDVDWELAFELARPFFFWNPAYFFWRRNFDNLRELSCDQAVLCGHRISPRAYAECLLSFCERSLYETRRARVIEVGFVRNAPGRSRRSLKSRILALENVRMTARTPTSLTLFGLVVSAGIVLSAASMRPSEDWSHDRLMLSTIVNLERLEARNRGF